MTSLHVEFPTPWAVLPAGAAGREAVHRLTDGMGQLDTAGRGTARADLLALLGGLSAAGVDGFATLALADEHSDTLVQAFCAVGVVPVPGGGAELGEAELRAVAEGGLHPGLERDTCTVELPLGPAVRSAAFRFAGELLDDDGVAPYAFELRFACPLAGGRIGVLHFETLTLVHLDELEGLFDSIAQTARLA